MLLKALKILRQLAQSGSAEFRSSLARRGKSVLAEAVTYRGQWDEIHGDRLNENIRTAAEVAYRLLKSLTPLKFVELSSDTDMSV